MFLAHVRARAGNEFGLADGSDALVQCFIPVHKLEDALPALNSLLKEQSLDRYDLSIARRYDADSPDEEYPADHVAKEVAKAAESGRSIVGTCFVSGESATFDESPVRPELIRRQLACK